MSSPLTALASVTAFPAAVRALLADYWITSVEEFVSAARAGNERFGSGLAALGHALDLPEHALLSLYKAAEGALPADVAFDTLPALTVGLGAVFAGMPRPDASSFDLPTVSLPDRASVVAPLPPPQQQGARSTCVAFALAAMVQQLRGDSAGLSPQFLYWACKERDGLPGDVGTRPDIAMQVLQTSGICREQTWPYRSEPSPDNPGHGPPPPEAAAEAQRCRVADVVNLPPDDIVGIKTLIATGKAVLLGLDVSEHWLDSWQARFLGRVRRPLPGERWLGGHAVLAIGYQDDETVPGGGYFVARNSWGTAWGSANADGAGNVHIPYRLVFESNQAAFAATAVVSAAWAPSEGPASAQQVQALYLEARQLIGSTRAGLARLEELLLQLGSLLPHVLPAPPVAPQAAPAAPTDASNAARWPGPLVLVSAGGAAGSDLLAPNGILATTGEPLLTIDMAAASELVRAGAPDVPANDPEFQLHKARVDYDQNQHLGLTFGDENALDQAGWAVVVSAHDDAALLEALSPLIAKRCADQGLPAPPLSFRRGETCGEWLRRHANDVNNPMQSHLPVLVAHADEDATGWLSRHGCSQGPVNPSRGVPFYLLLVARPGPCPASGQAYIPFAFQYELDMFWGVGRLCFTEPTSGRHNLEAYRRYAEQVVANERRAEPARRKHIVYFGTQHPQDRSTQLSAQALVRPLFEGTPGQKSIADMCGFTQRLLLGDEATRAIVDQVLNSERDRPAVLFTATHGVGFPADDPRLPAEQGALLCQDWPGYGSPKREHWYAAEDLSDTVSVDGLIVVCFACYSAGCPQHDQFAFSGGREAPLIAPYPLVAQLPQQLLARGALAVLGHVDRAWSHSFHTRDTPSQTQRFESVLGRLMQGARLGAATDQFNLVQGALSARLADVLGKLQLDYQMSDAELSALWTARNDARNYALLGDPAVQLPFRKA